MKQNTNRNFSPDELDKVLDFIWQDERQISHISLESIGEYAEASVGHGEKYAAERYSEHSRHLMACDACLGKYLFLVETMRNPAFDDDFEADLSFLDKQERPWREIAPRAWRLIKPIKIEIDRARIRLLNFIQPVQLQPVTAYATRSEGASSGVPSEMNIQWINKERFIRAILTGTLNGVHFMILGVQDGDKLVTEGLDARLMQVETKKPIKASIKKRNVIDFGVVKKGVYSLGINYQNEFLEIPIEISGS